MAKQGLPLTRGRPHMHQDVHPRTPDDFSESVTANHRTLTVCQQYALPARHPSRTTKHSGHWEFRVVGGTTTGWGSSRVSVVRSVFAALGSYRGVGAIAECGEARS